jgi:carbamoyltransferase
MQHHVAFPLGLVAAKLGLLQTVRAKLLKTGYSETAILEQVGIPHTMIVPPEQLASLHRELLSHSDPLHNLIRLFCLNLPTGAGAVRELLDPDELELLTSIGLLGPAQDDLIRAPVALWPTPEGLLATDHAYVDDDVTEAPDRVMSIGQDSAGLARMVAESGGGSALDLGCGSGVISFAAADGFDRVTGVDINPRALNFSRFNALLNGVENVTFLEGDLYEPVSGETFNLIASNPPYVPTPGDAPTWFRDGGPSGEAVVGRILAGLPEHLGAGGVCAIVSTIVTHRRRSYEDKLAGWLGGGDFECAVLETPRMTPEAFVRLYMEHEPGHSDGDLEVWLTHYDAEGIEAIGFGYLLVRHSTTKGITLSRTDIDGL